MARPAKLTDDAIATLLVAGDLPGWQVLDGMLHKTFQFTDFTSAWAFMCKVALAAEKMDHHPNWSNVYNVVKVDLNTHDVSGITLLDFDLARKAEAYSA